MRIERLDLAAFGRFTGHVLDFGEGTPDFHLLYGANEAGKSTTLAAIADLLYGIEEKSRFSFLHDYRSMLLAATVSAGDGTRLAFRRRKGRTNTLLDEAGAPMEETRLAALRGSEDRAFFTGMFGLDHLRLREGGEHILSAKGDLGQTLFQAGAAVRDLQLLLKQLDGDAAGLFKPGGQNPTINRGLATIREAQGRIRQNALKGEAWTQLDEDIARVQARLAEIATDRQTLMARRSQLERIRRVLPLLAGHARLVQDLAELADAPRLPEAAPRQRQEATEALATYRHAAEQAAAKLGRLREARDRLSVDTALLGALNAIAKLQKQHGAIAKALEDLPGRRGERTQVEARITALLRHLGRTAAPTDAHRILPTRPEVAAIRALITEDAKLTAAARQATQAAADAADLAARLAAELARLPPAAELRPLEECLKDVTRQGRPDDLRADAEAVLTVHRKAIAAALAALPGWSGDAAALARLPVPAPDAVSEIDQRLADAARRLEAAGKDLAEARDEEARADAELAGLSEAGPVVTEAAVAAARRRRNEGWRLVRHRFVEGLSVDDAEFAAGRPLPDAYEQSVAEADSLADRVTGEAQRAAQHARAVERQSLAVRRREEADKEATAAAAGLGATDAEWQALWQDCSLVPLRPRAMLGFLAGRKEILNRVEQAREVNEKVARLIVQIDMGSRTLAAALAAVGEEATGLDFPALVARVETVIRALDQRNNQRRQLAAHLDRATADVEPAKRRSAAAAQALADWRRRWGQALGPLQLAADAGTAEVQAALEVFDELSTLVHELDGLSHRIEAMEADVGRFESEVTALATAVAPGLAGRPALDGLAELAARAQTARDADRELHELNRQIAETEGDKQRAEDRCRDADEAQARLCRQAGCERPEQLEEAERRAAHRQAAEAGKAENEQALLDAGDGLDLEALAGEAASIDRDRIGAETEGLDRQLNDLDAETDRLKGDLAQHRQAQAAMNGDSAAAAAAEEIEQLSASLKDDAARYIRLRLGHVLLRQAVERFRQRHQGPLMQRAAELFHRLTLGAFAGLDTGYDDHDQPILFAVRNEGEKLEVKGLSEGTRDQLFLALRLAAVELHLAAGRRLPFIADDLLIHFDDDRAAAALTVLADLATRTQVLFFTHNRHLVDLARARLPAAAYRAVEIG